MREQTEVITGLLFVLILLGGCDGKLEPESQMKDELVTPEITNRKKIPTKRKLADTEIKKTFSYKQIVEAPLIEIPRSIPNVPPYYTHGLPKIPDTSKFGNIAEEWKKLGIRREVLAAELEHNRDRLQINKLNKQEQQKLQKNIESISNTIWKKYLKNGQTKSFDSLSDEGKLEYTKKLQEATKTLYSPKHNARILELEQVNKRTLELSHVLSYRMAEVEKRTQYSFSGVVVDEDGKTLSDVELIVKTTYSANHYPAGIPDRKVTMKIQDGKFYIRLKAGHGATKIYFRKRGYYSPTISMGSSNVNIMHPIDVINLNTKETEEEERKQWYKMGTQNKYPPIVFRKRHNIKIRLDKKGKVTNLKGYDGRLTYKSDNSGTVMNFSKRKSNSRKLIQNVKNIQETKLLPKHCMIFTAKPNKAVQFQDIYWDAKFKGVPTDNNHPVIEYRLIINDPDPTAGFYLVDPTTKGKYDQDRRMREAPENGYVQELVFGSKQKYQIGSFYIKINGKYGKCKIDNNGYCHSSNKASCGVKIKMQPDGSRNLEIPDWFVISPYLNYKPLAN